MQSKKTIKEKHPVVVIERDWREYVGECLLIVFSVILALGLTEYFTDLHDKHKADEILHQLKQELISNRYDVLEQAKYYEQVFKLIDSAKHYSSFAKEFLDSGEIHLHIIMPQGVVIHDLKEVAWQQAKENDVFSRIDIDTYGKLSSIYANQQRFLNLEPSMEKILISYDSRKQENLQATLTLIHDVVIGWAYARTPDLVRKYDQAIDKLKDY